MKVLVNGVVKELVAVGKNEVDYTNDLLGNYGVVYNEEAEMREMSEDDFEWWTEEIEKLNKINELMESLTVDQAESYNNELSNLNDPDLETDTDNKLEYLTNLTK